MLRGGLISTLPVAAAAGPSSRVLHRTIGTLPLLRQQTHRRESSTPAITFAMV